MSTHRISTAVTTSVILGQAGYASPLTITGTGSIDPAAYGATALSAPASIGPVRIVNDGRIFGSIGYTGSGTQSGDGGIGVQLDGGGTLVNHGAIGGGAGGANNLAQGYGGNGGIGVDLTAATKLVNYGTIAGGGAGDVRYFHPGTSGNGAIGVDLAAGGTLVNHGKIIGGNSGYSSYLVRSAGNGVSFGGTGTISNDGAITGGTGGQSGGYSSQIGGAGIELAAAGTVINRGTIASGNAGATNRHGYGRTASGIWFLQGGSLFNSGTISSGVDGNAVRFQAGGSASNSGTITGGSGNYYGTGNGVVFASGGTLTNGGFITGGAGAYTLGIGGSFITDGSIGVDAANAKISNAGTISGGVSGGVNKYVAGTTFTAVGGIGVNLSAGATLFNDGVISGGAGGNDTRQSSYSIGQNGGVGVFLDGASLTNAGTISGGAGGTGYAGNGQAGAAVGFGKIASTLIVEKSAVFGGALAGFGRGDVIDIKNVVATSLTFLAGTLTLKDGSTTVDTFQLDGKYKTANFTLSSDGHGGTDIGFKSKAASYGASTSVNPLPPDHFWGGLPVQDANSPLTSTWIAPHHTP